MRELLIVVLLFVISGCAVSKSTTEYLDGSKETAYRASLFSMQVEKKHASLRSDKGVGFALKFTDSANPLPTLKLGYWGSNQTFTPMVEATFNDEGQLITKEALPSTVLQLNSDPIGGVAVEDLSATGTAAQNATSMGLAPSAMVIPAEVDSSANVKPLTPQVPGAPEDLGDWANE